ncbi:MAG: hypothetical protein JWM83_1726 [Candidatus Angelobacter sp.]|nr:hypothetical protein [Candidatus Angelobacter sp.]
MQYANHQDWFFGTIRDQVALDEPETKSTGTQVRSEMTRMWTTNQHVDGALDLIQYAVRCLYVVLGDVFPNVIEVCKCVRMK